MRGLEAIKAVLSEQIRGYRALLELLQRERICLIGLNGPEVEQVAKEKDTILLKLRLFEEERLRLTREWGAQAGIKSDLRLKDIAEMSGDRDLSCLRSQLLSLLQGVNELNDLNKTFTERTLSFTRGARDRLLPGCSTTSPRQSTATVLSREV